jgi:hypothetical protein
MSLTSILKEEKARGNIKAWFKHHFPNPGLKVTPPILVQPKQSKSSYSGEIGTAFDYLVRFTLEKNNKNKISQTNSWIAENGLNWIFNQLELTKGKKISVGYYKNRTIEKEFLKELLEEKYARAKEIYYSYLNGGELNEELIESTIFLAKLDVGFRVKIITDSFDSTEKGEIDELFELLEIVPWEIFKVSNSYFVNPSFNEGSHLVGGADADLIIDQTLIDIKTTKKIRLLRDDLNQVLGYFLLSILGGVGNQKNYSINKVGIYFARYAFFWQMPVSYYFNSEEYIKLADEFSRLVKNKNLELIKR